MTEEQRTLLSSYEKLAEFLHGSMGEHVHTAVYEVNTETGEGRVAAAFGPHFGRREGGPRPVRAVRRRRALRVRRGLRAEGRRSRRGRDRGGGRA